MKVHKSEGGVPNPYKLYMGDEGNSYLFSVKTSGSAAESISNSPISARLTEQVKMGNAIMVGNIYNKDAKAHTVDGQEITMLGNHAYTLTMKGNLVQVENPHDTSKKISMTRDEAKKTFDDMFVGNAPGKSMQFPPELNGLEAASAKAAEARHSYIAAKGVFSVTGKQEPDDPKLYQAYINADKAVADEMVKADKSLNTLSAASLGEKIANEAHQNGKSQQLADLLDKDGKFFKGGNEAFRRAAPDEMDREVAKGLVTKMANKGMISAETAEELHGFAKNAKTRDELQSFGNSAGVKASENIDNVAKEKASKPPIKTSSVDSESLEKAREIMLNMGAKPSHLGGQIADGTQVTAQAGLAGEKSINSPERGMA